MTITRLLTAALALSFTVTAAAQRNTDYTRWVNPFIGTGGHGHTFPGAVMPFGMVQLSPDTRIDNWDGSSGYHYSDDVIYGFSHTHLSGTGIPDGCDILFMPVVGEPRYFGAAGGKSSNGYASKFSHANEKAEPGYYSVKLDDDGIFAELTATTRVGLHRYTFPNTDQAHVVLDLKWRDKWLQTDLEVHGSRRIKGVRRSTSWAKDQAVYFVAEFDQPFTFVDLGNGMDMMGTPASSSGRWTANGGKMSVRFGASVAKPILLKVAISYVSIEGARKNLEAELPHWDFDKVRADAKAAWNKELSKIEVTGGTDEQRTNFYTALYHTMIHPNVFNDVDGQYRGIDKKVHRLRGYAAPGSVGTAAVAAQPPYLRQSSALPDAAINSSGGSAAVPTATERRQSRNSFVGTERKSTGSGTQNVPVLLKNATVPQIGGQSPNLKSKIQNPKSNHYTVFSLWDTFRAAHPLYTIIDQKRTVDYINTFIRMYEQGGRLPVWELWGEETDTMIGYHAVSVIADAMAKGIKGFDYEKAYKAAKHSAELDHFGLSAYKKRGYISMEDENESVSRTLEYAYNDWCIAQMAKILMDQNRDNARAMGVANDDSKGNFALGGDYRRYSARARYFENLFDSKTGFFRAKKNGGFVEPFNPTEVNFGFTEGNSWQYSFFVPHDVPRLMELMGGREKFVAKLDELFTTDQKLSGREQADLTGLIGQYAHGNEPSHHIAYLYNYAGEPWKTQKYVRQIMDEFYKNAPAGLIGNEDCGQMSAWFIMSALGFYPVAPGETMYAIGTPLFSDAKVRLENGKTFTVKAPTVSSVNKYVASVKISGRTLDRAFFDHWNVANGGVLEFTMTDKPATGVMASPFKRGDVLRPHDSFVAVPVLDSQARTFRGSMSLTMRTVTPDTRIFYTLDGSEPTERSRRYDSPITINATTTIKAIAMNDQRDKSYTVDAVFTRQPNDWTVRIVSPYSRLYTGGGDNAIVDGIRGTTNFASGEWQGVQGKVYEAVVDLQRTKEIKQVGASFLQVAGPWIWMPANIKFEISSNGSDWTQVADIKPDFPTREMTPTIKEYRQPISATQARYVRLRAYNFGKIPAWHPGAGGDPWIFIDEVFID